MDDLHRQLHASAPAGSAEISFDDLHARVRRRRRVRWGLATVAVVVLVIPAVVLVTGLPTTVVEFQPTEQPPEPRPERPTRQGPGAPCDMATQPSPGAEQVLVYFGCERGTRGKQAWNVAALTRPAEQAPLRTALTAWLEGPNADERTRGYRGLATGLEPGDILDVRVERGHATVEFAADVPQRATNWSSPFVGLRVRSALNETVFQFAAVDSVTYTFGGDAQAFCSFFDLTDCAPLTAAEWDREKSQLAEGRYDPNGDDAWVTADEKNAWEAEHGESTWIVGYFLPAGFASEDPPPFTGLKPRWKRIVDEPAALDREDLLRAALEELGSTGPPQLLHPFAQHDIRLHSAVIEGSRLTLDFADAGWTGVAMGTTGEAAMLSQLAAVAGHYYSGEAEELCILIEGEPRPLFSHGMDVCPMDLPDI